MTTFTIALPQADVGPSIAERVDCLMKHLKEKITVPCNTSHGPAGHMAIRDITVSDFGSRDDMKQAGIDICSALTALAAPTMNTQNTIRVHVNEKGAQYQLRAA